MAHVKLSADDIILAYHTIEVADYSKIYTLVCRADINKPNSWNLIPSTDIAVINNRVEFDVYVRAVQEVQKFQEHKYPGLKEIKKTLSGEIDKFHNVILSQLHDQKTK